jgi:hypothetical protein
MKKSAVRFEQLRDLLEGLGFTLERDGLGWRFEHPSSQARFLFRAYRPQDHVYAVELEMVRSHLDWRGLMTPDVFDSSLMKTPA